ncbi:MAG: biopolymer transporter ExbD [Campylobacterota bacterium]|nr:biopolymer transporter ExbD [Campylobacterota bacterium]
MKLKKFDSIQIVPFIDIMLVLLVIVLTTASFVVKGIIPLDLSEGKSSNEIIEDKTKLSISIKENGVIYFNKDIVLRKDIKQELFKYKKDIPIQISCDKSMKFENFVFLLNILKEINYTNLGIITKR